MNFSVDLLNKICLDESKPIPIYVQLAEQLAELIRNGYIGFGEKFPSEEFLAKKLNVSRPTVNRAVDILIKESMVVRNRGRGTFVCYRRPIVFTFMHDLDSFGEGLKKSGLDFTTEVLEAKLVRINRTEAQKLLLEEGSEAFFIKRLRRVEKSPIGLVEAYLPALRFPGLLKHNFAEETLYSVLRSVYKIPIDKSQREVTVVKADPERAAILEVSFDIPLFLVEETAFSCDVPVIWSKTWLRTDRVIIKSVVGASIGGHNA